MDAKCCSRLFAIVCTLILLSSALVAQTTTQIFSAVDTQTSLSTAGYTGNTGFTPDIFSSTTLNMTCPAGPLVATLSGPAASNPGGTPDPIPPTTGGLGGGNLLVDNSLWVTVTPSGGTAGPTTNVCAQAPNAYFATSYTWSGEVYGINNTIGETIYSTPIDEQHNCFTQNYVNAATQTTTMSFPPGDLGGQDPDTYSDSYTGGETVDAYGGIPPIDISGLLTASSAQTVNIADVDFGGIFTGSSIYLTTNCTITGVSAGNITGNPIDTSTSTNTSQTFTYNPITGQTIGFDYSILVPKTITANNSGSVPQSTDAPVNPATFQANYVGETSFATSNCLVHTGEQLNGSPACKVYTLECTTPGNSTPAGDLCPVSDVANEVVQDAFDGPNFTLQNIYTPYGIFREGIGLLMATDTWPSGTPPATGPCDFETETPYLDGVPCPQNLLVSFAGPGGFGGTGLLGSANSTFISIYGEPEPLTAIIVPGQWPDGWINNPNPQVYFFTEPPNLASGAYTLSGGKFTALPNVANYIPAPIQSITYGVSPAPASNVPLPINEPIAGVLAGVSVLTNPAADCASAPFTKTIEPLFAPAPVTPSGLSQGQNLLYYYSEDCAGTQELQFTYSSAIVPPATTPIGWQTNFFTYPINIDTIAPTVAITKLSPFNNAAGTGYKANSNVTATLTCGDAGGSSNPVTGSGVVLCGLNVYAPETEYTSVPGSVIFNVGAASSTPKTLTVYAVDGAGNITPGTINYTVTSK